MEPTDPTSGLPFIDEHQVRVAAPAPRTWDALTAWIAHTHLGVSSGFAHLVGTEPRGAAGTLPQPGSTIPGFAVAESVHGKRLTLVGRHRFSRYALIFSLAEHSDETLLSARSHAVFPKLPGALYRGLVISSGGHRVIVRRMLRDIGRSAERR
ncbi:MULTISPECIES: hypothetical protein [Streptomyces]|uniref:hypothetical protein n=1 Tax=Streptomyces TaxID=1883 RepID=UPI00143D2726|nr:hypothetical protein [Streptomyces lasalocidi]